MPMPTKQQTRTPHPLNELGERILRLQESENLMAYELALKLGISHHFLSYIKHERHKGLNPKFWNGIKRQYPHWERYLKGLDASPPPKESKKKTRGKKRKWTRLAKEMPGPEELGSEIQEYRLRHKLNIKVLSAKLGISRNQMSMIERCIIHDQMSLRLYKRIIAMLAE
jgi:transcriptional regulator with XRE-family HTH domain